MHKMSQILSIPNFSSHSCVKDIKRGTGDVKGCDTAHCGGVFRAKLGSMQQAHGTMCKMSRVRQTSWRKWHLSWALKGE